MKKYFYLFFAILIGVTVTSCGGNSNHDDSNSEIERLKAEIAELKAQQENQVTEAQSANPTITPEQEIKQSKTEPSSVADYVGSYTIKDDSGTTYKLTINSDETVTLESPNNTFYGSAEIMSIYNNSLHIDFGHTDPPYLMFPNGRTLFMSPYIDPAKEYVYNNSDSYKSKNPKLRLKLK